MMPPAVFFACLTSVAMSRRSASSTRRSRLSATTGVQPPQQVHTVVVRHLLDQLGHAFPAGPLDHLDLPVDGEVLEDGGLIADVGVFEEAPDLLDVEFAGQRLGHGGGVQGFQELAHPGGVVVSIIMRTSGPNSR